MKTIDIKELEEKVKRGEDLSGIDLRGCDLRGANMAGAKMEGAMLRYTNFSDANLEGADLKNSNLRHTVLVRANLRYADLSGADLSYADLSGALVIGAKFKKAKLFSVKGVADKMFFKSSTLELLIEKGKAKLEGEVLIIPEEKKNFRLSEALRFLEVMEGEDSEKLIGRVKCIEEIKKMGCEVMPGSVILNDTVYRVEEGFIGTPVEDKIEEEKSDVDMLIEYILKSDVGKTK